MAKLQQFDFLIVGAGLAGAVAANLLTENGKTCYVIDKRPHIGGNCYTENIDGINVHKYGAHIIHTNNKNIWYYLCQFLEIKRFVNSPIAKYGENLYNLPFNMHTFYQLFGCITPAEAKKIIDNEIKKSKIKRPKNLEEQAISLVGKTIFEKLIKFYTEKQWGKPCNQLPTGIITRLPIRYEFNNNYFNDYFQGIPVGGYTNLFKCLLNGSKVKTNCDFKNCKIKSKYIIYTGPIDEFFDYKYGRLDYRSLKFIEKKYKTEYKQGNAVINYTDNSVKYTRSIEHKFFENSKTPTTIVSYEYPQKFEEGKNEPYYPINDKKNMIIYNKYLKESKKLKNIWFLGRLGKYRYFDMDDVIEDTFNEINKILKELQNE